MNARRSPRVVDVVNCIWLPEGLVWKWACELQRLPWWEGSPWPCCSKTGMLTILISYSQIFERLFTWHKWPQTKLILRKNTTFWHSSSFPWMLCGSLCSGCYRKHVLDGQNYPIRKLKASIVLMETGRAKQSTPSETAWKLNEKIRCFRLLRFVWGHFGISTVIWTLVLNVNSAFKVWGVIWRKPFLVLIQPWALAKRSLSFR